MSNVKRAFEPDADHVKCIIVTSKITMACLAVIFFSEGSQLSRDTVSSTLMLSIVAGYIFGVGIKSYRTLHSNED